MKRKFHEYNVIIEKDDDGFYVASVPALAGCCTQAKSLDQLIERVKEAILLCVEVYGEATQNEFVGVQKVLV